MRRGHLAYDFDGQRTSFYEHVDNHSDHEAYHVIRLYAPVPPFCPYDCPLMFHRSSPSLALQVSDEHGVPHQPQDQSVSV